MTPLALGYFQMMADFIRDGRIGGHYETRRSLSPTGSHAVEDDNVAVFRVQCG
jgi:hypothetical protein